MSNRSSVLYAQRQINHIFRIMRHFVKAFIDNIDIKLKSFNEHFAHFRKIFKLFSKFNILIKSIKVFFDYPNVILLKQRVNVLNLFIIDEKLKIIAEFKFLSTFKNLKNYLDLTDYIRDHIYYYFAMAKSLQNFETMLLKAASNSDLKRKNFISRIKIQFIQKKIQFSTNQVSYIISLHQLFCE